MNKWMVICMCAFLLCGCGTKTSSQDVQPAPTQEEQAQPTPSQTIREGTSQSVDAQPDDALVSSEEPNSNQSSNSQTQKIAEQEALEVALSHAGVKESDLTSKRIKMEWEDGTEVYDIEFHTNGKEYDYEIRASDGSILESDSEIENH